jgi:hypothetical protein
MVYLKGKDVCCPAVAVIRSIAFWREVQMEICFHKIVGVMNNATEMSKAHNLGSYYTLLYGEWNTKESASTIENCFPSIFSYLKI